MTIHTHRARRLAAATVLAVVAGVVAVASPASATPQNPPGDPIGADTSATVGGGGGAPDIECAWALNDVDSNWTNLMNYGLDDDPLTKPTPAFPCQPSGTVATQPNGALHMIQVIPNAHDEPTQQFVELWGAVTSSNPSGTIVYFDVYHPDGTFKVQVDGTKFASSASPDRCVGPAGMFGAATDNGEITTQAVANIVNECKFQQKALWYGAFGISKHQPYGQYRIDVHAAVAGGGEDILTYFIDVLPFFQLEKDFTNVQFGQVGPNSHYFQAVAGDFVWDITNNPANQKTSVRNTGNAGVGLDVRFHSMCLVTAASCTDDKRIDHFDVKYGKTLANLQSMGNDSLATALVSDLTSSAKPAPPGPWYSFDSDINRVLCPNDIAKIEFSIWTENIQAGNYTASPGIGLRARPTPICPTDQGHVYEANGYTSGNTPTSNNHHPII